MLGKLVPFIEPLHEIATPAADSRNTTSIASAAAARTTLNSATSALASGARVAQREHEIMKAEEARAPVMRPLRKSKRLRTPLAENDQNAEAGDTRPSKVAKFSAGAAAPVVSAPSPSPAGATAVPSPGSTSRVSTSSPASSVAAPGDVAIVSAPPPTAAPSSSKGLLPASNPFQKIVGVCDQEKIMWTKMKGHPFWPTQVVRLDQELMRQPRFSTALKFKRKSDDACVMYFGTCEVAWISKVKSAITWQEGLSRGLHLALKQRTSYQTALAEVLGYCAKQTRYPRTWWCEPKCMALAAEFTDLVASPNFERVAAAEMKDAENERVCWAKLRGYPNWPVQVLPRDIAMVKYPELKMRPETPGAPPQPWPCMFFGTGEIALVADSGITPFVVGIQNKYISMCERYDFYVSLGEVWGYLQKKRVWPTGFLSGRLWWNDTSLNADASPQPVDIPDRPKYENIRRSVYPPEVTRPPTPPVGEVVICTCKPGKNDAPDTGYCKDESCLNVASRFWCDPKLCPAGDRCTNVPFYKRKCPRLTPFYTSDQRGWGLRLEQDVRRGEFIIGYVGEILDRAELQRRLDESQRQGKTEYYIMDAGNEHFVDAERRGNLSRFINSSCAPNCDAQKWTDPAKGQTHVGIFALRDIKAGTELTYNYCFQDFGLTGRRQERSFVCRCRADTCCMIEPEERAWVLKTVGKRIKVRWDDGWYLGIVESYDAEKKQFKVLYDDGDDEELTLGLPTTQENEKAGIQFKLLNSEDREI